MIFVDASGFVALYNQKDQNHADAAKFWAHVARGSDRVFTSSFVLDEMLTFLARRAGYEYAAAKGQSLYASARLMILRPAEKDELEALELFRKFADQKISFTDCISFVLMRHNRIKQAFTFDHHFRTAGFTCVP
ncbi:MAG: PIN domain-containing protein [Planctomycetaceae bacterium]|nr:PIN domain-containing protein [Planctomycetaceae bacterium]